MGLITLSLNEALAASLRKERAEMQRNITERKAQIATLDTVAEAYRAEMAKNLRSLEACAASAAVRVELGIFDEAEDQCLAVAIEAVQGAMADRKEMRAEIAEHRRQIEDMERDLNDSELWRGL